MLSIALALMFLPWSVSCSSAGPTSVQEAAGQIVLAPGESMRIREFDITITFEGVVEDSRCPTGVDCIREGDAAVRIRIDARAVPPATYILHTSEAFDREIVHGEVRVRLVAVTPHPAVGSTRRPEDYRATLSIRRK